MLIDWFTTVAQVLNFLILVFLMKRFLYQPILRSIDNREKAISLRITDADLKKTEAQKESEDLKKKNADFDRQRAGLLQQATVEADSQKERLLNDAKNEVLAMTKKRQEALKAEEKNLQETIVLRAQNEVFAIARKALRDLADATLEERMVQLFIRRLGQLSPEEKIKMSTALKSLNNPLLVHSAFILSPEQMKMVEGAVHQALGTTKPIQFETAPDLISGIELLANGQKVSWTIAEYLSKLKSSFAELSVSAGS